MSMAEKLIPPPYETLKIQTKDLGFSFAWSKTVFLSFLKDEKTRDFAVLSGEILQYDPYQNRYRYSYVTWSVPARHGADEPFEVFAKRSRIAALEFINRFPSGIDIIFSPTITSNQSVGLEDEVV